MSSRAFAVIFGIVLIIVGILGFIPALTPNGYLLNLFMVDTLHNSFHILTGVIALLVSGSRDASRWYFKIIAVIYIFLAVLGLAMKGDLVFMHVNMADNILHFVIGAVAAYLGYGKVPVKTRKTEGTI